MGDPEIVGGVSVAVVSFVAAVGAQAATAHTNSNAEMARISRDMTVTTSNREFRAQDVLTKSRMEISDAQHAFPDVSGLRRKWFRCRGSQTGISFGRLRGRVSQTANCSGSNVKRLKYTVNLPRLCIASAASTAAAGAKRACKSCAFLVPLTCRQLAAARGLANNFAVLNRRAAQIRKRRESSQWPSVTSIQIM
jgi:hypothetical protein